MTRQKSKTILNSFYDGGVLFTFVMYKYMYKYYMYIINNGIGKKYTNFNINTKPTMYAFLPYDVCSYLQGVFRQQRFVSGDVNY